MANIKYSELLNDVLPSLAADPSDPVSEHAIKRAVIEFCIDSWVWKHLPDPLDVVAGEAFYDIELPQGADITAVMDVSYDGEPLDAKSVAWLNANHRHWRTETGTPRYYTQVDTEQVLLVPIPDANLSQGLTMTLALQPSQSSTSFPKWIHNKYMYALADGALARLMLMPTKPWGDINNGNDHRDRFEAAKANARGEAEAALGRAVVRSTPQH